MIDFNPTAIISALEFAAAQDSPHFVTQDDDNVFIVRDNNGTFVNVASVDDNGIVTAI